MMKWGGCDCVNGEYAALTVPSQVLSGIKCTEDQSLEGYIETFGTCKVKAALLLLLVSK